MRTSQRITLILAAVLVLAAPGFAAKKTFTGVPLMWKPTSTASDYGAVDLTSMKGVKVEIRDLADQREKPELIGENRDKEDKGIVLPVTTSDSVPKFVAERLGHLFGDAGLDVVAQGGSVIVTGEVKRFYVLETSTYQGEVNLRIEVKTPGGKVLWSGLTGGTNKKFGRSYKLENYYEALSDALMDAAFKLLQNDAFLKALSGKP